MKNAMTSQHGRPLPRTYAELTRLMAPRPIHDDTELAKVTSMIDRLVGFDLNKDQEDYLDALSTFVAAYEEKQFSATTAALSPVEILRLLLEEHGMSASDLGRLLGNRSLGPALLSGNRQPSKAHIQTLADHFGLNPTVLLKPTVRTPAKCYSPSKPPRRKRLAPKQHHDKSAREAAERLIALGGCDPNATAGRRRRSPL